MSLNIELRGKDGKMHAYEEKNVSAQKMLDALDMVPSNYPELNERQFYEKNVDFIAGLFTDKRVTSEAILLGINGWDLDDFITDVGAQLMGYDPKVVLESESPEVKLGNES